MSKPIFNQDDLAQIAAARHLGKVEAERDRWKADWDRLAAERDQLREDLEKLRAEERTIRKAEAERDQLREALGRCFALANQPLENESGSSRMRRIRSVIRAVTPSEDSTP